MTTPLNYINQKLVMTGTSSGQAFNLKLSPVANLAIYLQTESLLIIETEDSLPLEIE
jgi:hypothetical protein